MLTLASALLKTRIAKNLRIVYRTRHCTQTYNKTYLDKFLTINGANPLLENKFHNTEAIKSSNNKNILFDRPINPPSWCCRNLCGEQLSVLQTPSVHLTVCGVGTLTTSTTVFGSKMTSWEKDQEDTNINKLSRQCITVTFYLQNLAMYSQSGNIYFHNRLKVKSISKGIVIVRILLVWNIT